MIREDLNKRYTQRRQWEPDDQRGEEGQVPTTAESDRVKEEPKGLLVSAVHSSSRRIHLCGGGGHASELPHLARVARKAFAYPGNQRAI